MKATGMRAFGIWLGIISLGIALMFPLHITQIATNVGKDVIEARAYDVKITNYSDTTILQTKIVPYASLPRPSTYASSLLDNLGLIFIILIIISIFALLLEYFRAEEMGRFNQFALLSLITSVIAILIFYTTYSAYLFVQFNYGFAEVTTDHSTSLGIGLMATIFSTFLSFIIVLQGYTQKSR